MYEKNAYYPTTPVELSEPYIFRDYRGAVVSFNPFQYNPVTGKLKIIHSINVRISKTSHTGRNILSRSRSSIKVDHEFDYYYSRRFINYDKHRKEPVDEQGELVIISPDKYIPLLDTLVKWKLQKGIKTTVVSTTETGNTSTAIKNWIQTRYDNPENMLKWVLLVGDQNDIPSLKTNNHVSDPKYGLLKGTDSYVEIFVGRFWAQKEEHVKIQVNKTLQYEKEMSSEDSWTNKAVAVASKDPRKNKAGESDKDYVNVRSKWLSDAQYEKCTNIYEGVSTSPKITDVFNEGISVMCYSDHGYASSLPACKFKTSDAFALTNYNKYFFGFHIACNVGEFDKGTCISAASLIAGTPEQPVGAVGMHGGGIAQPWDPPYWGVEEQLQFCINKHPENVKLTYGGVCSNGCIYMLDEFRSDGQSRNTADSWNCHGDPTFVIRTDIPKNLTIQHEKAINPKKNFTVTADEGATVCLYNENKKIQLVQVVTNTGNLEFDFSSINCADGDKILITVTKQNHVPYQMEVIIDATKITTSKYKIPRSIQMISTNNTALSFSVPTNGIYEISLHSLNGKIIKSFKRNCTKGVNTISLKDSSLSKASYILTIRNDQKMLKRTISL